MKRKLITCSALLCSTVLALSGCFGKKKNGGDEYEGDRLVLNLRNLYFSGWDGSDGYTEEIQEKFKVKIVPTTYDNNSWGEQVMGEVNGNVIGDVFHFDLESFNFGNTYQKWAKGQVTKALPDDLSKWPNLKGMIDRTSNIASLKLNGKLYGIPISYNAKDGSKDFSSFTYIYRRDVLREMAPELVHENDEYTWDEFKAIVNKFKENSSVNSGNASILGDVSWGFPSLTNFYKDSPHCYSVGSDGKVVNAFTTNEYIQGLNDTRSLFATYDQSKTYYFDQVTNANDQNAAFNQYKAEKVFIYYDNWSLSNYIKIRDAVKESHPSFNEEKLYDMTAIMKVKGPDGKFHLEGSENWFSMTFFNYDMSDEKMNKILDIMEYLLSDEGTKLAVYGKAGYDYRMVDGEPELIDDQWPTDEHGKYIDKINGAKLLREMVTLNNDIANEDPFTDKNAYEKFTNWQSAMQQAKNSNKLKIFMEPAKVKWLTTELKDNNTSSLIKEGNDNAMNYCYGNISSESAYREKFNLPKWNDTIAEINRALGF